MFKDVVYDRKITNEEAITILKMVEAYGLAYAANERAIKALQDEMWIPIKEKLPEEKNETYWICTDTGYQCECRWTNVNRFWSHLETDWHWNIVDIPQYSKVVAWRPLPEPYKEI